MELFPMVGSVPLQVKSLVLVHAVESTITDNTICGHDKRRADIVIEGIKDYPPVKFYLESRAAVLDKE